jgi:hypothetical protein
MNEPTRIEINVETLVVDGMSGPEAAALVAAAERALNARLAGGPSDGSPDPLAVTLAGKLATAVQDGRGRAG